jgi:hypothetical protein
MYKLEAHLHTKGNSDCAKVGAEEISALYAEKGYNGIVCTNHFSRFILDTYYKSLAENEKFDAFMKGYFDLKSACEKRGIDVFFGVEFALKNDDYNRASHLLCVEILVYGISPAELIEYGRKIVEMSYKELYEFSRGKGWLIVQAHPYRERTKRVKHNYLDGLEVYNGHPGHIARNRKSLARAKKFNLLKTAGSDFHFVGGEGSAMLFEEKITDEKSLVEAIKSQKFTVIEGAKKE